MHVDFLRTCQSRAYRVECPADMYDQYLHIYEKLPLGWAGLFMGLALIALHGYALLKPTTVKEALNKAAENDKAGRFLLTVDFIWIFLLLFDVSWNPLRINLLTSTPSVPYSSFSAPSFGLYCMGRRKRLFSPVLSGCSYCSWPSCR